MVVLQAISEGRVDFWARSIAAAMASGSWPSMRQRPAGRFEALDLIDRVRERQRTVDRNAIVVKQHNQLVELEVSGERDRLLAEAFHQVAVGGEHIGMMVDDLATEHGGEVGFRHRHADGVAEALAERAGRGLDAAGDEVFRMTGVRAPSWRKFLMSSIVTES